MRVPCRARGGGARQTGPMALPRSTPAAGGGRWVQVSPERLDTWLAGFAERHGTPVWQGTVAVAPDGARAECEPPYAPLREELMPGDLVVGVLLVRLGGYAAGVFEGTRLTSSKVGSRQVHGRIAAGGTSQLRFARRRENQATVARGAAADNAVRVLLPHLPRLDALVTGGERTAVEQVLQDRRLAPLRPLVVERLLDVPDPRLTVLQSTPELFRAVRIRVLDPPG